MNTTLVPSGEMSAMFLPEAGWPGRSSVMFDPSGFIR